MTFNDQRGLSLVEILIAAAILGLGLAGVMTVVPVASYGVQEGSQLSTATFLAQQRIEQARRATWRSTGSLPPVDCLGLSASPTAAPTPTGATCNGSTAATFRDEAPSFPLPDKVPGYEQQYTRTVRITDCGTGAGCTGVVSDAMRLVTVTVSYRPMTGAGLSSGGKTVSIEWVATRQ
jgi:prepilin-type N-terminal cleavage/methylation domain-containing protein